MVKRIVEEIKEWGKVEQDAKFEGRNFVMILAPLQSSAKQLPQVIGLVNDRVYLLVQ